MRNFLKAHAYKSLHHLNVEIMNLGVKTFVGEKVKSLQNNTRGLWIKIIFHLKEARRKGLVRKLFWKCSGYETWNIGRYFIELWSVVGQENERIKVERRKGRWRRGADYKWSRPSKDDIHSSSSTLFYFEFLYQICNPYEYLFHIDNLLNVTCANLIKVIPQIK